MARMYRPVVCEDYPKGAGVQLLRTGRIHACSQTERLIGLKYLFVVVVREILLPGRGVTLTVCTPFTFVLLRRYKASFLEFVVMVHVGVSVTLSGTGAASEKIAPQCGTSSSVRGTTRHCSPDAVHQFRGGRKRFTRAGTIRPAHAVRSRIQPRRSVSFLCAERAANAANEKGLGAARATPPVVRTACQQG
ncbi:hypothetical protein DBV15_07393 [Temnothorax longispinosus]|uniref:Uncharacterized protein n=1 Tax=Temnothorax longispinosus TaxID=300112 RepID=A0A4S2KYJ2_9HYME|nr:hypothetical protein DBV15_07393 [Temnothorax longispinosus]